MPKHKPEENALRGAAAVWCRKVIASEGQSAVTRATGYSQSVLSRIYNSRQLPSLTVILALHRHYGEKHAPSDEVLAIIKRESAAAYVRAIARAEAFTATPSAPATPTPTVSESLASTLARVERKITAGTASSREAAQRVVECARRYASVVEQAHSHRLLVFLGEATGEGPSIQNAALELYDALMGVPELGALLAQPARQAPVVTPRREQEPAREPPQPATVEAPSEPESDASAYEVVVTRKPQPESTAPTLEYPALAKASLRNPMLIVGGVAVPEVRQKLSELGVQHEWIETRGAVGQTRVEAVTNRIRRTGACGVMVLHGTVGHNTFDRVRAAARLGVVPLVAPRAAGTAELVRSLHLLDKQIASGVAQAG